MSVLPYHFSPDVHTALVEAIPRICPSKKDLVTFFRGAGLRGPALEAQESLLRNDADNFKKFPVTRVLLNAASEDNSDSGLRVRREIIKRVTTFANFEACWDSDRHAAKGAVQTVRELVQAKDTVTRIIEAEDKQRRDHIAQSERKAETARKRAADREAVKQDLYSLFSMTDRRARGVAFEKVLSRFFALDDMAIREAFALTGDDGEGVVEQIDGVIELDRQLYLVEAKWWKEPLGTGAVAQHTVRVAARSGMRGLYIVNPGYTEPAVGTIKDALQRGVFVLATIEEMVILLESGESTAKWLRNKVRHALIDRDPHRLLVRSIV